VFNWTGLQDILTTRVNRASGGALALTGANAGDNLDFTGFTNLFLGAASNLIYTGTLTPFSTATVYSAVNTNAYRLGGGPARSRSATRSSICSASPSAARLRSAPATSSPAR